MSDRIRHGFTGALLLALAALLAIVTLRVTTYRSAVHLIEINRQVSDTGNAIGELRGLLAAVEHAEAGQNTYIISGDERDLKPYRFARQAVEQQLAAFRPRAKSDPAFQGQWRILEPEMRARIDQLDKNVNVRQTSGFDVAAKMALREEGRQSLDDIRARVAQLDHSENVKLQTSTDDAAVTVRQNFVLFLAFSVLDGFLLIAGFLLLRHYILQRDRAEAQMRLAKEAAETANRAKDEFLAMVSHDLRSPLNAIELWLTLLRRTEQGSELLPEALEGIEQSVRNQSRLVSDLLDVSRIVHGKFHVERKPMDLIPLMSAAIATVRPAAESKHVILEFESTVNSFTALGDSARLQQVAWNLLSNAIKFTPSGGHVFLRIRQMPQAIEIQVADTGMGIPAEFLPHVFDRFSQSETTDNQRKTGLGLGLAIVKHIVELHDGSVTAQSPGENQGATFTIRLPGIGITREVATTDKPAMLVNVAMHPTALAK